MLFSSVLSVLALAVSSVNAHGYVSVFTADGKQYKGPVAGSGGKLSSPVRQISTTSPYKDVNGDGMTCGRGAKLASVVAPVTAGSTVKFEWEDHPGDTWNHDLGPMITYMTKVPDGQAADKFVPSSAQFFKIAEAGLQSNGKWAQAGLMTGGSHSVTIPKGIPNGDYIIRHEIVALHLADQLGGVEFYTSCLQVKVQGGTGGANFLNGVETAKFPGGYKLTDKGIHVNVFNKGLKYVFPGPALAKFSGGTSSAKLTNSNNSTTTTPDDDETTTSSTTTTTKSTPTKGSSKSNSKDGSKSQSRRSVIGWTSRMHKRYLGAVAPPAPVHGRVSE